MLDLGCGSGRHVLFFAQEGYRSHGCDFSANGIRVSESRVKEKGLSAELRNCEADALEYADNSFDGILCLGVLYYLPFDRYRRAVSEIHRVLKKGGKALVITRTKSDSRFISAKRLGDHTYLLQKLSDSAPSFAEEGMVMTFLDRENLAGVFSDFPSMTLDRITVTSEGGQFINDNWHISLVK